MKIEIANSTGPNQAMVKPTKITLDVYVVG